MMKLSILFIGLISLLSLSAWAIDTTQLKDFNAAQVIELDQGACWAQQTEGYWRIASFNDHQAFQVIPSLFNQQANELLADYFEKLGRPAPAKANTSVLLHCSGAGHRFDVTSLDSELPICLSMDFDGSHFEVYRNAGSADVCQPVTAGRLVFTLTENKLGPALAERLRSPQYADYVLRVRDSVPGLMVVDLKKAYYFKEELAGFTFLRDGRIFKAVSSVSFDQILSVVGQSIELYRTESGN